MGALLERLGKPDMAAPIAVLTGLPEHIAQVRVRHVAYHAALAKDVSSGPTPEDMHRMHTDGQELLAQTVVLILAHYVAHKDQAITSDLLKPIQRQNEALSDAYRRRRKPTDVDPDTGEELSATEPEPAAEPEPT